MLLYNFNMTHETLNATKYYIENLTADTLRFANVYLMTAKLFDTPQSLDMVHSIIESDNFEYNGIDYYLINTYCMINNMPKVNYSEISTFLKTHKQDIEKFCQDNCLKNSSVSTHSFNGVLKQTIAEEGLQSSRKEDPELKVLHTIASKGIYSFLYTNSDRNCLCACAIPAKSLIEYATASPEWLEQYLNKCFNVTYEEYAEKDRTIIDAKIAKGFKDLEEKITQGTSQITYSEFETLKSLTKKYVDKYVQKVNPCIAIINNERDISEFAQMNPTLKSILTNFSELTEPHFGGFEEDINIEPEMLTIIELPKYTKVISQDDNIDPFD